MKIWSIRIKKGFLRDASVYLVHKIAGEKDQKNFKVTKSI
jgi:hypothetical protein